MWKFILKRLFALIPVLLVATFLVFTVLQFTPGDPARTILGLEATEEAVAELREDMGLNDPIIVQYVRYVKNLLRGDFGTSYKTGLPVVKEIQSRLPWTLKLAFFSIIVALIFAIPIGAIAGLKQNSIFDRISMFISMLGISLPTFWLGLLLILFLSVRLGWLPSGGNDMGWKSYIMPVLTLSLSCLAGIARTTRSSTLEVVRSDYVRTARSKGISETKVVSDHILQNAMIPTLTVAGLQLCKMISQAVLVENIFSWPGLAKLMTTAVQDRDTPLILGCIVVFATCFSIINLVVDILYGVVDPRIKARYKK